MLKQLLLFLGAVLIVTLVGFGCKREAPSTSTSLTTASTTVSTASTTGSSASCSGSCETGKTEKVEVALQLPEGWQKTSVPQQTGPASGHRSGCPATQMQKLLGVVFSSAHGCVIGKLEKGGPAEKSGLKVGDSIVGCNGGEVTCPSTLDPLMWITPENTAKLVVSRGCGTCSTDTAKGKTDVAEKPKTR